MKTNIESILVVDDETKIADVLKAYLENSNFKVFVAYNGKHALELFENNNPSLVILDLMLPDISGEEVCKIIRSRSSVPIIILTAKTNENDILKGFEIGADDYVSKPFSTKQLIARVCALLRRFSSQTPQSCDELVFNDGNLIINAIKHEISRNGEIINLTATEFKILTAMAKYPDKVFTRDELIILAFDENFERYDRTIDTHVKNIRQKLEKKNKNPKYILTIHGFGYRFGGKYEA